MEISTPVALVGQLERRWQDLETCFHCAYWDAATQATPENEARSAELELRLRRAKGDPEALARVDTELGAGTSDRTVRRQLEVARQSLLGNQMDDDLRSEIVRLSSSIESDFASYRPRLDGTEVSDNDIQKVLERSDDVGERRRAWEASKEIGAVVAERVKKLAELRNRAALGAGFSDYYSMSLALQELPQEGLLARLARLEELTRGPYGAWKEELDGGLASRFGTTELEPWHYADPFFQTVPPDGGISLDEHFDDVGAPGLAEASFGRWGIELGGVMAHSDLWPRPGKCQHAFCIQMNRGVDVRILANVVPGQRWVEVMLHESGHAAYDVCIDPSLPYLLRRPSHTFVTEGMAIMSGRLVRDPRWLVEVAGLRPGVVAELEEELHRMTRAASLLFTRWGLVMVHFERALYQDPGADLDSLWWDLVERLQLVRRPPDRRAPDWAAKVHIATAPVYYHNYLLGEMLATQLRAAIEVDLGGDLVGAPTAGRWLEERFFGPGASLRWDE
ncbi:MAG: M2 family metallopeptidase, partial [Actinobacteria bacterium]|nr:M2 family metallopeptidase [Actinomycetota bacterium]